MLASEISKVIATHYEPGSKVGKDSYPNGVINFTAGSTTVSVSRNTAIITKTFENFSINEHFDVGPEVSRFVDIIADFLPDDAEATWFPCMGGILRIEMGYTKSIMIGETYVETSHTEGTLTTTRRYQL